MAAEAFHFTGLESVRLQMLEKLSDLSYMAIFDRTDRRQEDSLGRFDLDEDAVRLYLAAQRAAGRGEEATPDDLVAVGALTRRDRIEAAVRWLTQLVSDNMGDFPVRRFRVRMQGLKGVKAHNTVMVTCTNREAVRNHRESNQIPMPSARLSEIAPTQTVAEARAVSELYARWAEIMLGTMAQVQRVNSASIEQLGEQLADSREQVDQLVAAILERNVAEVKQEAVRVHDAKEADTRTALARDALKQLGDATRTFFTAKGMPPEMADLFQKIGQSPELMSALNDPKVRELMNNPENLKDLSNMLLAAGQHATPKS